MEKINGIIYMITNLINGKVYIGQTIQNFNARISQHKYHARKADPKYVISRAIKKYGCENFKFEIIDTAISRSDLNQKESHYISMYNSTDKSVGYNLVELQDGIIVYSEERKIRQSKQTKERFFSNNNIEVRGRGWSNKKHTNYIGAYLSRGKNWVSYICCNLEKTYLGSFLTDYDAAMAYDIAAIKLFGDSAKLNFPELVDDYVSGIKVPERKPKRRKRGS